jgi:nucleoside-diphosphate-sugar epimerase
MKKALVLGGTRFFGIHLVESLLEKGFEVTIATRGESPDPFSNRVNRIVFDRQNKESFVESFKDGIWDVVYDQICYSSKDALDAIEVFSGKTSKYILTSSMSVYNGLEKEGTLTEEDYNPFDYTIKVGDKDQFTYDEGKRQAEAVFFQKAPFPVVAVRFPIVLGVQDYTERLLFHVNKVKNNEEIFLTNIDAFISFISEEEAGEFLAWLSTANLEGPINACSNQSIKLKELLDFIEKETNTKAIIATMENNDNASPFNIPKSWTMSNEKARISGFPFSDLKEWAPKLIHELLNK